MKHGAHSRRASCRRGRHRAPARLGLRGPAALAVLGTCAVMGTGVAAAYWTAGGEGSGSVQAGTATAFTTVTAAASTTSLLYPGGSADLTMTVRNPNPYPITVSGVSANGAVTAAGGIGTCTTTGVALTTPTAGLPFTVAARSGGTDGSLTVVLTAATAMSSASENGCQSAAFTVPVALTGSGS